MKRIYLIAAVIAATMIPSALQAQNFNENSYIEVHGKAEKTVSPDKITLSITINEGNYRNRTLEQMERDMVSKLKSVGINTDRKLKVRDMSSSLKYAKAKKQGAVLSKSYSLELQDATTATKVMLALEEIGLSNVYVDKMEYSAIDSLKLAVKADAVRNAKTIAETMVGAIGQQLGKAFFIYEQDAGVGTYRTKAVMLNAMADGAAVEESIPEIEFQDIKVSSNVTVRFNL